MALSADLRVLLPLVETRPPAQDDDGLTIQRKDYTTEKKAFAGLCV